MKKIFLIFIVFLLLILAGIYIIIPNQIKISQSLTIEANKEALFRKLSASQTWREWWPGEESSKDTIGTYLLNGIEFKPDPAKISSFPMLITANGFATFSELTLIPLKTDSTTLHMETSIPVSRNPFKRVRQYLQSPKLKNSFSTMLYAINRTYTKIENLYGYNIQKKTVVDSTLIYTYDEVKGPPDINKIYSLIDELKNYIIKEGARETGYPMLNIYTADRITYLVKVAIPVDKKLPASGKISYRWMLGGGNILITEVRGGEHEIKKAYEQITHYISDYQRVAPAIPFESLVTDRRKEPDSSKWITRIYYPVM